jgi:hypothetical protein
MKTNRTHAHKTSQSDEPSFSCLQNAIIINALINERMNHIRKTKERLYALVQIMAQFILCMQHTSEAQNVFLSPAA